MKLVKSVLSLCIAFLLLCTSAFAYGPATLDYLDAKPEGVTDNTPVTREQLAYSVSRILMSGTDMAPEATAFSDVDSSNEYAGYIKFMSLRGIMNGSGDGLFLPKQRVTLSEASAVLVKALGYGAIAERKGGWPGGYTSVCASLKLYDEVDLSTETVTWGALSTMLRNLLSTQAAEEVLYSVDGNLELGLQINRNAPLFAEKNLDLYEYSGTVTDIDYENYEAEITFSQGDEEGKYEKGSKVFFAVSTNVNLYEFEGLPVSFVLYEDELIVDIVPRNGAVVRYGVVDSVNNEYQDVSYNTGHIRAITLAEDENDYDFSADCIFTLNGNICTGQLSLMHEYVRIVVEKDEIVALSMYDLTDGGMITKVDTNYIYYKNGGTEKRMEIPAETVERRVVIDGEIRGYKELKAGMMFSYYMSDTKEAIAIYATEKRLTDVLGSVDTAGKTFTLGNFDVSYSENVYASADGKVYQQGEEALFGYCGQDVIVSLDIYGCARYVELYSGKVTDGAILAYLLGYAPAEGFKKARMQMINLSADTTPTEVYELADKVTYEDELPETEVFAAIGTTDGSAIYEIELNSKKEIKSFAKLREYRGFEGKTVTTREAPGEYSFIDHGTPYLVVNVGEASPNTDYRKLFIPKTTPVYAIDTSSGEVEVYQLPYSEFVGKYVYDKVTLRFFGYESSPEMRMIVMTGNISAVANTSKSGIVERYATGIDAQGDEVKLVTIDGTTYRLLENSPLQPVEDYFVSYTVSLFEKDAITIDKQLDFQSDFSTWDGLQYGKSTLKYAIIEEADNLKVHIDGNNGSRDYYYYEPGLCQFMGVNRDGELVDMSYQDMQPGMEVVLGIETASNGGKSVMQVFVRKD